MNTSLNITRRAAILGLGAATITGIATAEDAVAAVTRSGAIDPDTQLNELTSRYVDAAKIIDPTIKGAWIGTDPYGVKGSDGTERPGPVVMSVYLEREQRPFVRKGKSEPTEVGKRIRAHRRAWQRLEDACSGADEMHPDYRGEEGQRAWDRASRAEERALKRLLRFPLGGAERSRYLFRMVTDNGLLLDQEHWVALLRSSAGVI